MSRTVVLAPPDGLRGRVAVPPSKSYTHRAVVMASLARGRSVVRNALLSRDTKATIAACEAMGARIRSSERSLTITGTAPQTPDDVVNVENSGTTLRFMSTVFSLPTRGATVLTGDASIRRRPMGPLLDTLREMGVDAWSTRENGCAPVVVKGGGLKGGEARMKGDVSSQFVSSVLISAPLARSDTTLLVSKAVSRPYIDATIALSSRFGIKVGRDGYDRFTISCGQDYGPRQITVPADFSSASFIIAVTALVGGEVELLNLNLDLPQGDSELLKIVERMGVKVIQRKESLRVVSDGGGLIGGTFDLRDTPDLLPVVAVLGLKCSPPVEIVGAAHARFKETDRIAILAKELSKVGAGVEEREDGLKVGRAKLKAALLDAHDDHRMFMAFSMVSMMLKTGTPVAGVESLDVSYPGFLKDIRGLGAKVKGDGSR